MSCILNNGIALGCKDSLGGIKQAYIASFTGLEVYTLDADGVIDSMGNTETFYKFEQRNEQGSFVQNGNHSVENGSNFWEQVVELIFTKSDSHDRNVLKLLAQSTLLVIVKDQNDTYWLLGKTNGADLTSSTQGSGKAYGDLNGTTVGITAKEAEPAFIVDATTFGNLPKG
jgi:hypothetical protein